MLKYIGENNNQVLRFDTEEIVEKSVNEFFDCPERKHFYSKVYDENEQLIDEFEHKEMRDRVYFYRGYIAKNKKK